MRKISLEDPAAILERASYFFACLYLLAVIHAQIVVLDIEVDVGKNELYSY